MKRDGVKWLIGKRMGGGSGGSGNAGKERREKEGGGEPVRWKEVFGCGWEWMET